MNVAATVNTHKQKSKVTRYLCSDVELWDSLRECSESECQMKDNCYFS